MNNWIVVIVIGVGTYLTRLSFIGALGSRAMPLWAQRPLKFVAPSVLAALVLPAVLIRDADVDVSLAGNPRFLAAVAAGAVAWRLKNVAAVIVVGMGMLWILEALV